MVRFNNYQNAQEEMRNLSLESRTSEKVSEVNRNVGDMRSDILRVKIMAQAMLEIMVEQGVDADRINAKIEEIISRPETFESPLRESKPCPRCGRMILDNGTMPLTGTCLYCGAVVRFPPHLNLGNKEEQPQDLTQEPALDPTQDFTQEPTQNPMI